MKNKITIAVRLAVCSLWLSSRVAASGWTALANPYPYNVSTMLLLSDGSVMAQADTGTNWYRLLPDNTGHYTNGTWPNNIKAMNYTRLYYASDVLPNGKVFVAGGEYTGTNSATDGSPWVEIYDPVANSWTDYGPAYFGGIADGGSVVLSNGQVLVEPQASTYGSDTFIFNPANDAWSETTPNNSQVESSWVKLPDDSILTVDSDQSSYGALTAERYLPSTGAWTNAGTLPVSIWADLPISKVVGETGPGFLLPNGNAIFFGGNGHTAIYVYASNTWIQGPDIPNGQVMADMPGAMMNNGKILLDVCNQLDDHAYHDPVWPSQVSFYVYDYSVGSTGAYNTNILAPGGGYTLQGTTPYVHRMLALPDGTVLFTDDYTNLYVFQPDSAPLTSGKPNIQSVSWNADATLHLTGTLFNGISQGAAYGDDAQMDSNYPLVCFTDGSGNVTYGRTYNWSSTSVMTGSKFVTTECKLPLNIYNDSGTYSMQVVANGNASDPVTFHGSVWVNFSYTGATQNGNLATPYKTLAQGTNAVTSGGTVAIDASVQPSASSETMTISKPMTIISVNGPSTIGH